MVLTFMICLIVFLSEDIQKWLVLHLELLLIALAIYTITAVALFCFPQIRRNKPVTYTLILVTTLCCSIILSYSTIKVEPVVVSSKDLMSHKKKIQDWSYVSAVDCSWDHIGHNNHFGGLCNANKIWFHGLCWSSQCNVYRYSRIRHYRHIFPNENHEYDVFAHCSYFCCDLSCSGHPNDSTRQASVQFRTRWCPNGRTLYLSRYSGAFYAHFTIIEVRRLVKTTKPPNKAIGLNLSSTGLNLNRVHCLHRFWNIFRHETIEQLIPD